MSYSSSYTSSTTSSTATGVVIETATDEGTSSSSLTVDMTIATSSPDDSDGLSAVLGGDAIALGEDTLTVGSVSAEMVDGGSVTTLSGTVDMLAAAETTDGATAQALADTFADISSGTEFSFSYTLTTTGNQQSAAGSATTSTSTTGVTAYNLSLSGGDAGGTFAETDPIVPLDTSEPCSAQGGAGDDGDIDGNIAILDFDVLAVGEDTFVGVDAFVLAVEDELSSSSVIVEVAIG
jgi:hypothetical protein